MSGSGLDRPRAVFALTGTTHRDLALVEAVCAGWFVHGGQRHEFGLEPDWGGHEDTAANWQRALATFAWGLDLAHAYRETAEPRFLAAWERLVLSWIKTGEPERDAPAVIARRLESWAYAWDAFAAAPAFEGLSPGLGHRIVTSVRAQVRHLRALLQRETHPHPDQVYALLIAALAFPGIDVSGTLLTFAAGALSDHLRDTQRADGVLGTRGVAAQRESLRPLLGLRENARRVGFGLPADFDRQLEQACDVLLHIQPRGDAAGTPEDLLLLCAAELLQRGDLLWAASRGQRGVPPVRRNVSFPDAGYHVQRSAWGTAFETGERFGLFDTSAGGDPLRLQLTTGGHTVAAEVRAAAAEVRFVARRSAPGLDILHGRAVVSGRNAGHDRQVVFVADEYWLVHDRMHDANADRHEVRLQLDPAAHGHTTVDVRDGNAVIAAPGVTLVVAPGATPIDVGLLTGPTVRQHPGPLFSLTADGVAEASITTLVLPLRAEQPVPTLEVYDGSGATAVEVHGVGADGQAIDFVAWADRPTVLVLGEFRIRATAAWVRQSHDGKVLAFGATAPETPVDEVASVVPVLYASVLH